LDWGITTGSGSGSGSGSGWETTGGLKEILDGALLLLKLVLLVKVLLLVLVVDVSFIANGLFVTPEFCSVLSMVLSV